MLIKSYGRNNIWVDSVIFSQSIINMKKLLTILLVAVFFSVNSKAAGYLVVRHHLFGGDKLKCVSKPNHLHKWYYDSNKDTYLREINAFGIPMKNKNGIIKRLKL